MKVVVEPVVGVLVGVWGVGIEDSMTVLVTLTILEPELGLWFCFVRWLSVVGRLVRLNPGESSGTKLSGSR